MFERFVSVAKKHPLWIAGGVLFAVILIYILTKGSSASTAQTVTTTSSEDPNVLAANTALTEAQLQSTLYDNLGQDQLSATENTNATNLGIAQLLSATSETNTAQNATAAANAAAWGALGSIGTTSAQQGDGADATADAGLLVDAFTGGTNGTAVANAAYSNVQNLTTQNDALTGNLASLYYGAVNHTTDENAAVAQDYYSTVGNFASQYLDTIGNLDNAAIGGNQAVPTNISASPPSISAPTFG